ncbi:uncharacterized protein K02A2.6-like [Aedes albopictus]|uniref:RNA-directed DNA polymerase n=1 Tax=Aedes albopictus TaxID=7160 RepID=A0ABM1YAC0_AEDAL
MVSGQTKEVSKVFKAYGGNELPVIGAFTAIVQLGDHSRPAEFYVVQGSGKILIGRDTATEMGVLKISTSVNKVDAGPPATAENQPSTTVERPSNINEPPSSHLGTIKDVIVDIPINPEVTPVIQPYRRIPVALENLVDRKIDELLAQGVIEKVNEPSKWVSPMVVVPKGDDVRICVDMRRANEAVARENHPLPTIEDFLPHLAKAKVFSRLDVKNAFHQVEISQKSREITTFITRRGLYRYTRLMFGINCAPELFQKMMEQILCGCEGCVNFIDDVIVFGADQEEHDARLQMVLRRMSDMNVLLNNSKCVYGVTELKFLGHFLSDNGITPDSDKLESIKNFREPKTAEETRSFLGLVNYVGKFIPNLATLTEPLRQLTRHQSKFVWNREHQTAFEELKRHLMNPCTLGYFDGDDRTQLIADASPVGLGAVLIQINDKGPRIISYASRSLTDVEKRYAQIEKEALALVWAVERFHYYLFGRSFDLITDHKPLEAIFGPKSKPCARIERWVVRLLTYKGRVIYRPGKSNIADPLSRLAVTSEQSGKPFEEYTEHYVNWVAINAAPVALKLTEIEQESERDEAIKAVGIGLQQGEWCEAATPFKLFCSELCFAGKILLRGTRMVIPENLRARTLDLAHEGHPGMTIMKQRLRAKVWWPKLDTQVEKYVKGCRGCALVAAPAPPEPMKRKELPSQPWQHVAIDFLGPLPSGHYLFVVVDYFSRYIEVEIMKKTDSTETIKRLSTIFARFGLPVTVTADNGPQFTSEEFRNYCESSNIKLISTTPYWPQQNGEVERQNRSILERLSISQATNTDWLSELNKYLLMYRSSPHSTTGKTPSEMLFGYNIRDKVPSINQPKEIDEETADRDREKKEKGKLYADERRNAKPNSITEGDKVLVKRMTKPNKLATTFEPVVYDVIKRKGGDVVVASEDTGTAYRRHVSHLQRVIGEGEPGGTCVNPSNLQGSGATKRSAVDLPETESRSKRPTRQPGYLRDYV